LKSRCIFDPTNKPPLAELCCATLARRCSTERGLFNNLKKIKIMDLYCIKSHSQGLVKKGLIYPLISDKCPCKCNAVDVGVRSKSISFFTVCMVCGTTHTDDGIDWISKKLFVPIDEINIEEATECLNELILTQ
jgi:hypothetical protein